MIEMTKNKKRAHKASIALSPYADPYIGIEIAVVDLLADLRHYCSQHSIDFDSCLRMSAYHFDAEVGSEE
jgi:hypothetical protein